MKTAANVTAQALRENFSHQADVKLEVMVQTDEQHKPRLMIHRRHFGRSNCPTLHRVYAQRGLS